MKSHVHCVEAICALHLPLLLSIFKKETLTWWRFLSPQCWSYYTSCWSWNQFKSAVWLLLLLFLFRCFFFNSNGFFWSSFCFSSWVLLATLLTRMCPCTVLDVYLLSLVSSQVCHTSEGFTIKWRKADEYPRRALESDRQDLPPTSPPHARTKVVFRKRKKEREREKGGLKKEKLGHILFFLLFCFVFSSEVLV